MNKERMSTELERTEWILRNNNCAITAFSSVVAKRNKQIKRLNSLVLECIESFEGVQPMWGHKMRDKLKEVRG